MKAQMGYTDEKTKGNKFLYITVMGENQMRESHIITVTDMLALNQSLDWIKDLSGNEYVLHKVKSNPEETAYFVWAKAIPIAGRTIDIYGFTTRDIAIETEEGQKPDEELTRLTVNSVTENYGNIYICDVDCHSTAVIQLR